MYHPESLSFWNLSIPLYSKKHKSQRSKNWICFRPELSRGRHSLPWGLQSLDNRCHIVSQTCITAPRVRMPVIIITAHFPSTSPGHRCFFVVVNMTWDVKRVRVVPLKGSRRSRSSRPSPENAKRSSSFNAIF
jgi:hypothetical protein